MSVTTASLPPLFDQRVDAGYARMARILVGCAAFVAALDQWIVLWHVLQPGRLSLPYLPFVPRLSVEQLPILIGIWLVAAVAFIIGRFIAIPGVLLFSTMSYALAVDQQAYSNYLYLLILLTSLVTVAKATDSEDGHTVAAWPILLLKVQLTIVYAYSVLFKLNPVFLSGDMIGPYLRTDGPLPVPAALTSPALLGVLAIITLVIEAFLAVAFWVPRLRLPAFVLGIGFHITIVWTMDVGMMLGLTAFALEMLAMYVLFLNLPSWASRRRVAIARS